MSTVKIGLDDLDILRKYRLQTINHSVSAAVDEFSCEAKTAMINISRPNYGHEIQFGVGKKTNLISSRHAVNGLLGVINGGA